MAVLGSPAWLEQAHDPAAAVLAAAGDAVRVQYVVPAGPDGEVRYATVVAADGSIDEPAGDIADPDVTLTITYPEAVAIVHGEVSPNASFMRGRTKVAGHTGVLLRLLAAAQDPAYEAARTELAARTDPV